MNKKNSIKSIRKKENEKTLQSIKNKNVKEVTNLIVVPVGNVYCTPCYEAKDENK